MRGGVFGDRLLNICVASMVPVFREGDNLRINNYRYTFQVHCRLPDNLVITLENVLGIGFFWGPPAIAILRFHVEPIELARGLEASEVSKSLNKHSGPVHLG